LSHPRRGSAQHPQVHERDTNHMGQTFTVTAGGTPPIDLDEGKYPARFDGVEPQEHPSWAGENQFGKYDDGRRMHFKFTLLTESEDAVLYVDGDAVELDGLTNVSDNEKSKFMEWLGEIAGRKISAGVKITEDEILGNIVYVKTEKNPKGYLRIVSVQGPAKVKKFKASAKAAPAIDED
jgi:hypothetical protein